MWLNLSLSANERLFGLLGCGLAFLLLVFLLFRRFGHYRLIADTPTALIRSAPQGYVEIVGHVIGGEQELLRSPLSDRACVWYRVRVDQYQSNSNGKGGRWQPIQRETSSAWFQIDDGSGVCLVDPEGAKVSTQHKRSWFGRTPNPNPNRASGDFHAYASAILSGGESRYRYSEELIFEHEQVYALGCFRSVGGGRDRLDLKQASGDLLRSWKNDPQQLLSRFDSNGDGQIDLQEWEQARAQALSEAQTQQRQMDTLPTMHVLADPQQTGQPYLLSTYDEAQLMKRHRWSLAGLLLAIAVSVWLGLELMLSRAV